MIAYLRKFEARKLNSRAGREKRTLKLSNDKTT